MSDVLECLPAELVTALGNLHRQDSRSAAAALQVMPFAWRSVLEASGAVTGHYGELTFTDVGEAVLEQCHRFEELTNLLTVRLTAAYEETVGTEFAGTIVQTRYEFPSAAGLRGGGSIVGRKPAVADIAYGDTGTHIVVGDEHGTAYVLDSGTSRDVLLMEAVRAGKIPTLAGVEWRRCGSV